MSTYIKTLSVVLDGETICNKKSKETFVHCINHISNKIGKKRLCKDFPKIFSKSEFVNKKRNEKYQSTVNDDSEEYFIHTNLSNDRKKTILEIIYKRYDIDIEVSIIEELVEDKILADVKSLLQNGGNAPMCIEEISRRLKTKEEKICEALLSDSFDRITTDKTRYRLSNYLPTKLVDSIKAYDFVTIDMLIDILSKSGVTVNI